MTLSTSPDGCKSTAAFSEVSLRSVVMDALRAGAAVVEAQVAYLRIFASSVTRKDATPQRAFFQASEGIYPEEEPVETEFPDVDGEAFSAFSVFVTRTRAFIAIGIALRDSKVVIDAAMIDTGSSTVS